MRTIVINSFSLDIVVEIIMAFDNCLQIRRQWIIQWTLYWTWCYNEVISYPHLGVYLNMSNAPLSEDRRYRPQEPLYWHGSTQVRTFDELSHTQFHVQWNYSSIPLPWASGLPVAIQCAWNLDPSVHWNAIGEIIVGSQCASSGLSSGLPVCSFQLCNLTLDHHWDTTGC